MRCRGIFLIFNLIFLVAFAEVDQDQDLRIVDQKIEKKEKELEKLERELEGLRSLRREISDTIRINETRPKIGLVLSGGGAKGAAHIGVIRVLEEYGIPIDYITGTSFGSLIGALYTSGYTPDEMEEIILTMDWASFRGGEQAREYTSIASKLHYEKYFLSLGLDETYNLRFPKGVMSGKAFYLELKSLLWRMEGITDFDDLPIPYRAVATNLNTGERYVVEEGDLAKAAFMSMALPTLFDPVKEGEEFYVDGALVQSLPVQEVIEMGADIVIAVDITADSAAITDDSTVFEVVNKMSTYRGEEYFKKATELADILIVPDVKDHAMADFTGLAELIGKGEAETRKHEEALLELGRADWERRKPPERERVEIRELVLTGNENIPRDKILAFSQKGVPGKYSQEELNLWMNKLKARPTINRIFYRIEDDRLIMEIQEREARHLRAGVNYSSDFSAALGVAADLASYGFIDRNYMILGEASKYPKLELKTLTGYRVGETQYLRSLGLGFTTYPLFIYDKEDQVGEYNNYNLSIDGILGAVFLTSYVMGGRVSYIKSKNSYERGSKEFEPESNWDYYKGSIFVASDSRDSAYFPNKGVRSRFEYFRGGDLGGSDDVDFYGPVFKSEIYLDMGDQVNLEVFASGGKISGDMVPENEYYKIGGVRSNWKINQFSFYGMNAMRKYTDEFYMAGANIRYRLTNRLSFNLRYNVVTYDTPRLSNFDEDVEAWDEKKHGVGVGLGWNTVVGPMEFIISNDVDTEGVLFLVFLGYDF